MCRPRCCQRIASGIAAVRWWLFAILLLAARGPLQATVLWDQPGTKLVRDNGPCEDILHGAIKPQDSNSTSTLYFRFRVHPIADSATKSIAPYEAGFVLVERAVEHLGLGNSRDAWAYCGMNVPKNKKGYVDLKSATPEPPFDWEYVRANAPKYIAFKVEYVPGRDARVTAWLNPDLSLGATEINQPTNIVTRFEANATFDEIRLVFRGGNGGGWEFSQMVAGTAFDDLLLPHFWQRGWFVGLTGGSVLLMVAGTVQLVERRRAGWQIQRLEKERVLAAERTRIAQDIHDEVGSSLTKITKLTEMEIQQARGQGGSQAVMLSIADMARDTVRAMDEIVWAINPKNDTLKELADYLVYFTEDFLRPTGIAFALEVPLQLPDIPLAAEVRHNLFMAVKEALNNAVKHAVPGQIKLGLVLTPGNQLTIEICDTGRGFSPGQVSPVGNGLENMEKRLRTIGGEFDLQSKSGEGTRVRLQLALHATGSTAR